MFFDCFHMRYFPIFSGDSLFADDEDDLFASTPVPKPIPAVAPRAKPRKPPVEVS